MNGVVIIIYFITDSEFIKIGMARNEKKRLQELQTGNPRELSIIGTEYSDNDALREKELHKIFSKDRLRSNNEWFFPSEEIIEYINNISKYYIIYENGKIFIYNKMKK